MDIERSIIKKYRRQLWARFIRGVKEFDLIKEGDKIAVCISGGKDSMLLAKLMQELSIHSKYHFELVFIVMNPGYSAANLKKIKDNLHLLNIDAIIFENDVFKVSKTLDPSNPCYMCARMRRGALYQKAQDLGCNKIALGHHFDDVIETIMLNILYAGIYKTMMPKLKSTNFNNMELIRPMYYIKEEDIISWAKYNGLSFLDCACFVTKNKKDSKRQEIKELIKSLKKINNNVDINIMRSAENVNLEAILAYQKNHEKHNFKDWY